jgi:drug/metabolite transporter (DMT)-like permease
LTGTAACAFGLGVPLAKLLTGVLSGFLLAFVALSTGGLLIAGYLALRRRSPLPRLAPRAWLDLLVLAAFGTALPLLLVLAGFARTSAIIGGVLIQAQGPAAALFAALLLRERPTWLQIIGVGVLAAGSVLVVWQPGAAWDGDALGVLLVLGAALGYGFALIPAKRLAERADALQVSALRLLLGGLFVAPLVFFQAPLVVGPFTLGPVVQGPLVTKTLGWSLSGALALYIVASNCVSYLAQQVGLRALKAWEVGAVLQTIPLFAALFALLILGETPTPVQIVGGVTVMLGGVIVARGSAAPERVVVASEQMAGGQR